eukprot:2067076-Prorocentrum_lima.AAC.1
MSGELENGRGSPGRSRSTSPSPRAVPTGTVLTRLTLTGGRSGGHSGQGYEPKPIGVDIAIDQHCRIASPRDRHDPQED